ncbi:MAG TPA: DNA primase [candidate division Zixibacteria bacterium]|nr:DNA primase [candidate division Zixibacteria bacterium]
MPLIPEEIIAEVRQATDIVAVIGQHLPLRKAGANYRTLCPFHQEKTPSFNVNPQKQIWHCFGCGKGGNVFTFITEYEKVSFGEAVRSLAKKAGIRIPELPGEKPEGHDLLYQANEFAARFFQSSLEGSAGAAAREYLETRGISQETTELFRLGYAPNSWDELIKAAERAGLSQALLLEAGLIVTRERGSGHYDRFRHRVMFPFFSLGGRVIGFGGRSLEQSPQAKYLNSPETAIYHKGRGFFGFAQTKTAIMDAGAAVLVEGNFDLLRPFQEGYKNIVATAGTALTPDQARLLSRYARTAVVCYDPDGPGLAAAERSLEPLLEAGLDPRVALLPEGLDPDGVIQNNGAAAFGEVVTQAVSFVEFRVMRARKARDMSLPAEKSQLVNGLIGLAALVADPVRRSLYYKEIADTAGLEESLVADLARKRQGMRPREGDPAPAAPAQRPLDQWEREILGLLIRRPNLVARLAEKPQLTDFLSPQFRKVAAKIDAMYQETSKVDEPGLFHAADSPEEQGLVSAAISLGRVSEDSLEGAEGDERKFADYLQNLERQTVKPRLKALQTAIREAQRGKDLPRERELLEQFNQLIKETGK